MVQGRNAHTLEHIPEPLPVLRRLVEGLRPGAAAWLEVPLYPGRLAELFRRLDPTAFHDEEIRILHEHVAHFSQRSLTNLAERSGLAVRQAFTSPANILGLQAVKP